ncbi:MAG: PAS domain S-box protein [Cyanosarcina radialis HA8281-LM2]|jgi:PAS domain S-box-containing protein|nr:PAS domain S-box protein [Cyanosarcina radialis HA8281-LM2]
MPQPSGKQNPELFSNDGKSQTAQHLEANLAEATSPEIEPDCQLAEGQTVGELERFFHLPLALLAIVGFDGYFKRLNPYWERILGYSEAELLSQPYIEFIHPDDRAASLAEAEKITKEPHSIGFENRYRCQDGSYRWLMWNATAVPEQELIYCVARDITAQKQIEENLQLTQEKLDRLIASSPAVIYACQPGGDYPTTFVSSNVTEMLGYDRAEFLENPKFWLDRVHPDDLQSLLESLSDLLERGYCQHEYRFQHRDGSYRWVREEAKLIRDASARPLEIIGYWIDITERQAALRERKQAERERDRLIAILEASTDHVGMADPQGRVLWNNSQAKRILGLSPDADISHLSIPDYHPQWALDIIRDRGLPTAIQEGIWVGETALLRGNGSEMPVSQMIIAHKSPAGEVEYFSTIMRDLSVFQPIEAVLREQTQFLRSIYEGVSQPIFVVDVLEDGTFCHAGWNPATERLTGKSSAEVTAKPIEEIFPPLEAASICQNHQRCIDAETAITYEELLEFEGKPYWSLTTLHPLKDTSGRIYRLVGTSVDITARKESEANLLWRDALLRAMTNVSPLAFYIADQRTGDILYFNHRFGQLWGIERLTPQIAAGELKDSDILARSLSLMADSAEFLKTLKFLLDHEDEAVVDEEMFLADGRTIRHFSSQIRDDSDRYFGRLSIFEDITERKLKEVALQDSEEKFRVLVTHTPVGIYHADTQGRCLFVNPYGLEILGRSLAEVQGWGWSEAIHPDDRDRISQKWLTAVQTGQPFAAEYRLVTPQGKITWVNGQAIAIGDGAGAIEGYLGTFSDITASKAAEVALQASEARYRAIVEDQTELICRYLPDGRVTFVNDAYCRYFSKQPQELIGNSFLPLIPEEDWETVRGEIASLSYDNPVEEIEHRVILPDGQIRWQRWLDRALLDSQGQIVEYQGVGQDITERKQREEVLRQITLGVSAQTGEAFFHSLVECLSKALNIEYAFVGELLQPAAECPSDTLRERVRIIAMYSSGQILLNRDYALTGTPSEQVINQQQVCAYNCRVQEIFPHNLMLREMGIESYIGIPLFNSTGQVLGLISAVSRQPLVNVDLMTEVLTIFAVRASSELERQQAEIELKWQHQRSQLFADITLKIRQSLQLDDILQTTVNEVQKLLGGDRVVILQLAADGEANIVKEAVGDRGVSLIEPQLVDEYRRWALAPANRAKIEKYYLQGLCSIPDVENANLEPEWLNFLRRLQVKSRLAIPILLQNQIWGILLVHQCDRPRSWSDFEINLLEQLANQVGIALAQAHLLEALQESEQRYVTLAKVAPVGIFRTDDWGNYLYVNDYYCKITGLTPTKSLGQGWVEALHPEDRDRVLDNWEKVAQSQVNIFSAELRFQRSGDGITWTYMQAIAERRGDGSLKGYVGTLADITDRKRTEAEIRELNQDLEQRVQQRTAQLEAINQELEAFSYSVSHDLRAPLRSINGFSQALLEDYAETLDELGQNYLHRIRTATQRMGQLIDDLLALSRVTRCELQVQSVNLSLLAAEIARELQQEHPQRQVEWAIAPMLLCEGDPQLLRVVLVNLLGNAWKFTGNTPHPRIEFSSIFLAGRRIYCVRDNGSGFDMAYVNKLFGAFQRLHTEAEFPGTGIGLATVQRIIHRHQGKVWATSILNRGATFYFTLQINLQERRISPDNVAT